MPWCGGGSRSRSTPLPRPDGNTVTSSTRTRSSRAIRVGCRQPDGGAPPSRSSTNSGRTFPDSWTRRLRPTSSRRRTVNSSSGTSSAGVSGFLPPRETRLEVLHFRDLRHGGDFDRSHWRPARKRSYREPGHSSPNAADLPAHVDGPGSVNCGRAQCHVSRGARE